MADSQRIVRLEDDGSVPVTIVSGGGTGGTASSFGGAFPATGTAAGFIDQSGDMAGATLAADGSLEVTIVGGGTGGGNVNLTQVGGASIAIGQAAMAASLPVVIASNQSAVPVSAASLPLPTGAATAALQTQPGVDIGDVTVNNASGAAAVNIQDGGNSITVDGTVAIGAGSAVIGHVIADTGSTTAVTGNVTVVQGTGTNLHAVIDSGTVTAVTAITNQVDTNLKQVGGTNTVTGGVNGTLAVGGNVATNVAIGTNPINNGAQAVSSENAAVTAGRMVQLVADLVGKLIVLPYSNPENFVSGTITSAMTGTTSTSLVAAPASGLRNYLTSITVSNASITVPTDILIQDGSGGTTLYVIPCPAGTGTGTGASGATITFPVPLRQPTTATAIFVANVTTGSSTKASAVGYKGA